MPTNLNATNLVLIPKINSPENINQFHPIALCNVIYKIMAKVLVNGLKQILSSIINASQSAFVPGHAISENILIASEVIHYMKRK